MVKKELIGIILKEIEKGNDEKITENTFKVSKDEFFNALEITLDEKFIKDIQFFRNGQENKIQQYVGTPKLTLKGIEYLEDNF
ncbi:MAG: YjcQ family protein [Bacilli bacterium]|nr:YjcQ family protein [Bacilli bacterium]